MSIKGFTVYILAAFAFLVSCSQGQKPNYYLKDKWKMAGDYSRSLKAKPQKVTDYQGIDTNDINVSFPSTIRFDAICEFDDDGDPVLYSVNGGFDCMVTHFVYKDDGFQIYGFTNKTTNGKEQLLTDFKKVEPGKYLQRNYELGDTTHSNYQLIEVKNHGDIIIKTLRVSARDSLSGAKFISYAQYDGQKILHHKVNRGGQIKETDYEYSSEGLLQRVAVNEDGTKTETIFENNEQGDAVKILVSGEKNDTVEFRQRKFIYDKKGNWVRMLEEIKVGNYKAWRRDIEGTKVYIREIKY